MEKSLWTVLLCMEGEFCPGLRSPCCVCSKGCRTTSAACLVCPLAAAGFLQNQNIFPFYVSLTAFCFELSRQALETKPWVIAVRGAAETKWPIVVTAGLFVLLLLWWFNRKKKKCFLLRQEICCFKRYLLRVCTFSWSRGEQGVSRTILMKSSKKGVEAYYVVGSKELGVFFIFFLNRVSVRYFM